MKNRVSKTPPPNLPEKLPEFRLGPRQILRAGMEAKVKLPGRATLVRARFLHADLRDQLTFVDPRTGGLRTVRPDAVSSICRSTKLR